MAVPDAERNGGREGFTLLEVLVAFLVFAGALGLLFQVFGGGLRQGRVVDGYATATLLAESRLAAVGIAEPLSVGQRSGRFDERFGWRLEVRPYAQEGADLAAGPLRPYRVAVTVTWEEGDEERSVSLATLRLATQE